MVWQAAPTSYPFTETLKNKNKLSKPALSKFWKISKGLEQLGETESKIKQRENVMEDL